MAVQALRAPEALCCCAGAREEARARWMMGAARGCGTRREAGEGARRRALQETRTLTRAGPRTPSPGWVQLAREIRLRSEPSSGAEARLGAGGPGLQEGEDARVLGVLGLHPLHGGEVMH